MDVAGSIDGIRQVVNIAARQQIQTLPLSCSGPVAVLAPPLDLVTPATLANTPLVSYHVPLVAKCLEASISRVRRPTPPRHGVLVPNAPMPCCSLLPLWKP